MINTKYRINIIYIVVIIFLSVIQVVMLNRDSTAGEKLSTLLAKVEEVDDENTLLSQKIASASALATISDQSKQLGLDNKPVILSLKSPMPIAFGSQTSL